MRKEVRQVLLGIVLVILLSSTIFNSIKIAEIAADVNELHWDICAYWGNLEVTGREIIKIRNRLGMKPEKKRITKTTEELFGKTGENFIPVRRVTPRIAENKSYYGQISKTTGRPKTVHVKGYYRKDGTYVRGHYRSKPKRK